MSISKYNLLVSAVFSFSAVVQQDTVSTHSCSFPSLLPHLNFIEILGIKIRGFGAGWQVLTKKIQSGEIWWLDAPTDWGAFCTLVQGIGLSGGSRNWAQCNLPNTSHQWTWYHKGQLHHTWRKSPPHNILAMTSVSEKYNLFGSAGAEI